MALRDQPYLPLYVQDYLTDERLNLCSPSTQGVYIKIMCVFHKSEQYGGILLKQKDKQKESMCLNFAYKLAKLLPFQIDIITESLNELIDEKVLLIDGDFLYQKRMVKDNSISIKRSESGKKGGDNSLGKDKNLLNQNDKQIHEDEYEDENTNESLVEDVIPKKEPRLKTWKNDFEMYKSNLRAWFEIIPKDKDWILQQERYNPNVDILLTIEKGCVSYWATEAGWKNKKKAGTMEIDWKSTFTNNMDKNKVYKPKQ